jgi:hypothetical protein
MRQKRGIETITVRPPDRACEEVCQILEEKGSGGGTPFDE